MLPSGLVDGAEKADDAVVMRPVVKEVGESADGGNSNDTKPENEGIIHMVIIAQLKYGGDLW